ncbi:MAG: phosphotransferase [Bacteroidota bacterium]
MDLRNKIFWIGQAPDTALEEEFKCRDLEIEFFTLITPAPVGGDAIKKISGALGVVFVHDPSKLSRTIDFLQAAAAAPTKYSDVRVAIIAEDTLETKRITGTTAYQSFGDRKYLRVTTLEKTKYRDFVRYFSAPPLPWRAPNFDLTIKSDSTLTPGQETLLRRSFSEYVSLDLQRIAQQGYSGSVHLAYPQRVYGMGRGRPQPFLVKFDEQDKVERERNFYKEYVITDVPFDLRPNIDEDRCFFSADVGILVANYVDRSVSLLQAIEKGGGSNAIHCLFEESMDRWSRNSWIEKGSPIRSASKRFRMDKFVSCPEILIEARKLGAVPDPDTLISKLESIPCAKYRHGTSHGDLHVDNVLVKGSSAIIIDFSSCGNGPILIDFATLDVTIAFKSIFRCQFKDNGKFEEWVDFIRQIYAYKNIVALPPAREGFEAFARYWASIRQVRRYALSEQEDKVEFALCVASELLRHSAFVDDKDIGTKVAAYAYYLSSELVSEIEKAVGGKTIEEQR